MPTHELNISHDLAHFYHILVVIYLCFVVGANINSILKYYYKSWDEMQESDWLPTVMCQLDPTRKLNSAKLVQSS
jgi:hypothetical protein